MRELEAAAVPYAVRKGWVPGDGPPARELDIEISPAARDLADGALWRAGFRRVPAPGRRAHRFYVRFEAGRWWKIDARLSSGRPRQPPLRRVLSAVAMRGPAAPRRIGPVVAILGVDGAGKGTVVELLAEQIPIGLTVLYLGIRRRGGAGAVGSQGSAADRAGPLRETAYLVRRFGRMQLRLLRGYVAAWRGHIVLCDRHPVEVLAIRPPRTRLGGAVERVLVGRLTPWPDAIVVLDAPTEVLYARKPEHPVERIDRWRNAYRSTFAEGNATFVSTTASPGESAAQVAAVVWDVMRARCGWPD